MQCQWHPATRRHVSVTVRATHVCHLAPATCVSARVCHRVSMHAAHLCYNASCIMRVRRCVSACAARVCRTHSHVFVDRLVPCALSFSNVFMSRARVYPLAPLTSGPVGKHVPSKPEITGEREGETGSFELSIVQTLESAQGGRRTKQKEKQHTSMSQQSMTDPAFIFICHTAEFARGLLKGCRQAC